MLQGGYNLEATAAGVEACMRVCLGERPPPLRPDGRELPAPSAAGLAAIREALILQVHAPARGAGQRPLRCVLLTHRRRHPRS